MRTIPAELAMIADWLAGKKIKLPTGHESRRIDATKGHTHLLDLLAAEPQLGVTPHPDPNAGWYSFEVSTKTEQKLFAKIKISNLSKADNLNCKLGIYYALTGVVPTFRDEISWAKYFRLLRENLEPDSSDDFYFLVVNRSDSSHVFCNSLKGLADIRPNGNNVPFQCKWADNQILSQQSNSDAANYVLEALRESARQRADMYKQFTMYFDET